MKFWTTVHFYIPKLFVLNILIINQKCYFFVYAQSYCWIDEKHSRVATDFTARLLVSKYSATSSSYVEYFITTPSQFCNLFYNLLTMIFNHHHNDSNRVLKLSLRRKSQRWFDTAHRQINHRRGLKSQLWHQRIRNSSNHRLESKKKWSSVQERQRGKKASMK